MEHNQCLTEETLTDYLEGGLDPAVKAASEVHLLGCDDCRQRLAFFMKLLSDEVSQEEASALESIQEQWDSRKFGRKLPHRTGTRRGWFLGLAGIAAGLLAGILTIPYVLEWSVSPGSASEVVDLLLSQQRPFEARISGQPHLQFIRTRGLDDSGVDYGLLAGEMTELSADTHQMGRFYLAQKDFNRAIRYLEIAEQEVGASPDVHNDLGVAYLESGGGARMNMAAEEFRHALRADPAFAAAVFNLAVFYERTLNESDAQEQWKRFLQMDPDSPWADEARSKLEGNSR